MAPRVREGGGSLEMSWEVKENQCKRRLMPQFLTGSSPAENRQNGCLIVFYLKTALSQDKCPICLLFYFFNFILFLNFTILYWFCKYRNESATGIQMFPILNPPTSSLLIPSLLVVPVHQPQASSIVHQTWTGDSFHI